LGCNPKVLHEEYCGKPILFAKPEPTAVIKVVFDRGRTHAHAGWVVNKKCPRPLLGRLRTCLNIPSSPATYGPSSSAAVYTVPRYNENLMTADDVLDPAAVVERSVS